MPNQATICKPVIFEGCGLFSDRPAAVRFVPADAGAGISFRRTDLGNGTFIPAHPDNIISDSPNCTTLAASGAKVSVVEHVMACLAALSIDNVIIEVDGEEMPSREGCANDYFDTLSEAGRAEQDAPVRLRKLMTPLYIGSGDRSLILFPAEELSVSYLLSHSDRVLGTQFAAEVKRSEFIGELLPARTFITEDEAKVIIESGILKHNNPDRAVLITSSGPNKKPIYENEPARHKAQDILGDLSIYSMHLCARVIGIKSGHQMNHLAAKRLKMMIP